MAITITGTISRIELLDRAPYKTPRSYGNPCEVREFYADVALDTEEGTVYFKTPAITRRITTGGPFAIVTFSKKSNGFIKEVGENSVATRGKPNDNKLVLTKRVGDKITVEGRLKANKVSKRGNAYRVINYVVLLDEGPVIIDDRDPSKTVDSKSCPQCDGTLEVIGMQVRCRECQHIVGHYAREAVVA